MSIMLTVSDILVFIKEGFLKEGISIGMSIVDLKNKIGEPSEVTGDAIAGYIFYGYIRFGYLREHIDEIAISFLGNSEAKFKIDVDGIENFYDTIDENTKVYQVVQILNFSRLAWHAHHNPYELDHMTIYMENAAFSFELDDGCLTMISVRPPNPLYWPSFDIT